jgi:SEC-C motif-containing protein
MKVCPCGSQKRFLDCCGLYIQKKILPETPEALMRSRYTAYVEERIDYIRRTMRGAALLSFDKKSASRKVVWLGLEVISSSHDQNNPSIGYVEFKARYRDNQETVCIHERSKFERIERKWYYVDKV